MKELTQEEAIHAHKKACESWPFGDPVTSWTDENGYLCIRYSGKPLDHWIDDDGYLCIRYTGSEWYHYAYEDGAIVWW